MSKSDQLPRVLFGKTYVWLRTESGKLALVSTAVLGDALARVKKVVGDG